MKNKYLVMVTSYGFATIEADSESEAIHEAESMKRGEFDWSDDWNAEVIEERDE